MDADQDPPSPGDVQSYDELAGRLRRLRAWSGVTYRELHRRVVHTRRKRGTVELPAYNTVYRCLQPGRSRVDVELVVDVAGVLLGDETRAAEWRNACQAVEGIAGNAAIVAVSGSLPDDAGPFVGRTAELAELVEALDRPDAERAPTVAVVEGMAGAGKTRLAVRAAHALAATGRFGEVVLSVNLRGYDAALPPADPAAVLDGMLRQLGVAGGQLATMDLRRRTAKLRALLAERAGLVLLDNAASVDQVLPLLPGSGRCAVLVTSRQRLAELPGTRVSLGAFTPQESLALLRHTAGRDRIDADLENATGIAELAGRLPLAVALAGSRIGRDAGWTLADHREHLAEQRSNLGLDSGMESVLRLSYDNLGDDHRTLLRRLATHPGRDADVHAAAALLDATREAANSLLHDLVSANLLRTGTSGRFELHDLIRVYAAQRARDEDSPRARRAALTRLFDYYRYTALRAMDVYSPAEKGRRPDLSHLHVPSSPAFDSLESANDWLAAERANLLAAGIHCGEHGRPGHLTDLSVVLFRYLEIGGRHQDGVTLHGHAGRFGESRSRGRALIFLSATLVTLGRHRAATHCLDQAQRMVRAVGDGASEACVLATMGGLYWRTSRYSDALAAYEQALLLYRRFGDRASEGRVLGNLGVVYGLLGWDDEALTTLRQALALVREVSDWVGERQTLLSMAGITSRHGRERKTVEMITQARTVGTASDYRLGEAEALTHLGVVHAENGRHERALEYLRRARDLARQEGAPETETQALNAMGAPLRALGRLHEALRVHGSALAGARERHDRLAKAMSHDGMAEVLAAMGEDDTAGVHRRQAREVFGELVDLGRRARVINELYAPAGTD